MNKIWKSVGAAAISAMMAATTFVPAQAAMGVERPSAPVSKSATAQPLEVQYRRHGHRRGYHRDHRGRHYYNGHRGYRHYRKGYRRHGNAWYPAAAFLGGAIIGGAIANSQSAPRVRRGSSHVQWCYDRYRSYRASDNTYQPYNGPRRQCNSPYR
ncbi:BA14K family protein [Tianweitania sp. BSSL-BM11]|uniref:Lectin-like protein BA14k n=1 Tax=Tianweitania aestuarii TaxID=2814886 RepID=A0ABS5RTS4_9HYPH|nr:BA14K family protein [Tianweitania aestuarii]MBS9720448.1 BA14K family protein [Tianweitania aestuarii]